MLQSYLPVIVFVALGMVVGGAFTALNKVLGPSRPSRVKSEPYECGLPSEVTRARSASGSASTWSRCCSSCSTSRSSSCIRSATILNAADSVFVLVEVLLFVVLLFVGLVYVWRRGALNWK